MKKVQTWCASIAAVLLLVLAMSQVAAAQAKLDPPRKLRVVVLSEIMTLLPFWIATETGEYKKRGLDVEVIQSRSGSDAGRILISGSADIGGLVAAHAMKALDLGQPLRVVLQLTVNSTLSIITRSDLHIKPGDWAALKGKRFGMTSPGSDTDLLVRAALSKNGIDPNKDASVIAVGGALEAVAAFRKQNIDGFLALAGMRGVLMEEKLVDEFWSFKNDPLLGGGPSIAIVTRDNFAKAEPEVVRAFVQGTLAAVKAFYARPQLGIEVASKVYKFSPEVLKLEIDNFVAVKGFPIDGKQDKAAYEATLKLYREAGLLKNDLPYEAVFDNQFLQ